MNPPSSLLVCTVTDVAANHDKCEPHEGACDKMTHGVYGPVLSTENVLSKEIKRTYQCKFLNIKTDKG